MRTSASPIYRCVQCRTRRVDAHLMFLHELKCPRPLCHCEGYHYTHRPGSKFCTKHPCAPLFYAMRADAPDEVIEEIRFELVLSGVRVPEELFA